MIMRVLLAVALLAPLLAGCGGDLAHRGAHPTYTDLTRVDGVVPWTEENCPAADC
jgi:hypothetical protein